MEASGNYQRAESAFRTAERGITVVSAHQRVLFSDRRFLERRIEMVLNTDHGSMIRRNWRYLLAPTALIAVFIWLLISNRTGGGSQPPHQRGNMANTSQFQYPTGAATRRFSTGFSPKITSDSSALISPIISISRDKSLWLKQAVLRASSPSSEIFAYTHPELERQPSLPHSPAPHYLKSVAQIQARNTGIT